MANLEPSTVDLTLDLEPDAEERKLFDVLDDEGGRAIVRALSDRKTAKEVADHCDLPISTVYRKLEELTDASVVDKSFRGRPGHGHEYVFRRRIEGVYIDLGGN